MSEWARYAAFWLAFIGGYTGVLVVVGYLTGRPYSIMTYAASLATYLASIPFVPVMVAIAPRWVARSLTLGTVLSIGVTFAVFHLWAGVWTIWSLFFLYDVLALPRDYPLPPIDVQFFVRGVGQSLWLFVLMAGVHSAGAYRSRLVRQERAAAALQTQLAQAQVSVLRMQLNPHFLFNTLNAISGLVGERPQQARRALAELADLLRGALQTPATDATLADEVSWLRRYLKLQGIRFEDRLDVTLDVPESLEGALVPGFLLQPLVENAFEHGVAQVTRRGAVVVRARREGERLAIDVMDNGPGLVGGDGAAGGGLGVRTTRERLTRTYGDDATFEIGDRPSGPGAHVRIELPYRTALDHA